MYERRCRTDDSKRYTTSVPCANRLSGTVDYRTQSQRRRRVCRAAGWDYKVPAQSYAHLPGPYQTAGVYFLDQSGTGRSGEITIYDTYDKINLPWFNAIGRALAAAGTTLDITQSTQPANPAAGNDRIWADVSGVVHHLHADGTDCIFADYCQTLGGALSGRLPNPTLAPNSVGAAQVVDGSLPGTKLGAQTVQQSNMAQPSIGSQQLFTGAAATNIGPLTGALAGSNLPATSIPYVTAILGTDVATSVGFQTVLFSTALTPVGAVWLFFWSCCMTSPTAGALLSAGLFTPGGSVLSNAGSTLPTASGEVTVHGMGTYTVVTNNDQLSLRTNFSASGTTRANDANFASGSATYIRGIRIS